MCHELDEDGMSYVGENIEIERIIKRLKPLTEAGPCVRSDT